MSKSTYAPTLSQYHDEEGLGLMLLPESELQRPTLYDGGGSTTTQTREPVRTIEPVRYPRLPVAISDPVIDKNPNKPEPRVRITTSKPSKPSDKSGRETNDTEAGMIEAYKNKVLGVLDGNVTIAGKDFKKTTVAKVGAGVAGSLYLYVKLFR